MSAPVTPAQAVNAVKGDIKVIATQATTAYANLAPEAKADFHQFVADLESTYGISLAAIKALFPTAGPSPAPVAAPATK